MTPDVFSSVLVVESERRRLSSQHGALFLGFIFVYTCIYLMVFVLMKKFLLTNRSYAAFRCRGDALGQSEALRTFNAGSLPAFLSERLQERREAGGSLLASLRGGNDCRFGSDAGPTAGSCPSCGTPAVCRDTECYLNLKNSLQMFLRFQ